MGREGPPPRQKLKTKPDSGDISPQNEKRPSVECGKILWPQKGQKGFERRYVV